MKELDWRSQGPSVLGKELVNQVYKSNCRPDSVRSADKHWGFGFKWGGGMYIVFPDVHF